MIYPQGRTFRIIDTPWHIGHQYEMLKFPFVEWSWLKQHKRGYTPSRGSISDLFQFVTHYEPGRYDAAILHLDQECLHPYVYSNGKGRIYQDLDELIQDIPKIVIMHGTPHAPEFGLSEKQLVAILDAVIGNNYLVVNSHEAAAQWGCGRPLIHGMKADEWVDLPKEPRVITVLSPDGMSSYYDRPFLAAVREALQRKHIIHCHVSVDFVSRSWTEYRNFLGRSLLYFNPAAWSPMPRARTEAMLSGCCVLTTPHQDAERFIEDGVNGFLIQRDPRAVADLVEQLFDDPDRARAIGRAGKRTAQQIFSWERFQSEWYQLLCHVTEEFRCRHGVSAPCAAVEMADSSTASGYAS